MALPPPPADDTSLSRDASPERTAPFAWSDITSSAIVAGIVAVVVGYAGPTVIVFKVAQSANLSDEVVASWLWSYSIASGIVTILASWLTRQPLIMAWSTPGIAFLVHALHGVPFSDAVGAFLISNAIIFLIGSLGWFRRIIDIIPLSTAAALNAGILMPFALQAIAGAQVRPGLVLPMIAVFFLVRMISPRWAVASVVLTGFLICKSQGLFSGHSFAIDFAMPVFTAPTFTLDAAINIAFPLTVLALTGQYLPGFAVLRGFGYAPDTDRIVRYCGLASMIAAPFGTHNINPSSMIAGIVASPEAAQDPGKRYVAAITAGFVYLLFGSLAAAFVKLFIALPSEAIMTLAGVSLLAAIANSMKTAFAQEEKDILTPAVVFVAALSNFEVFSIGSSFWAILIGLVLSSLAKWRRQ